MPDQKMVQRNQEQQAIQVNRQENMQQEQPLQQVQNAQQEVLVKNPVVSKEEKEQMQSALKAFEESVKAEQEKPNCPALAKLLQEQILFVQGKIQNSDTSQEEWKKVQEVMATIVQGYQNIQMNAYFERQTKELDEQHYTVDMNDDSVEYIRNTRAKLQDIYDSVMKGRSFTDSQIYKDFCTKFEAYQKNETEETLQELIAACNVYIGERNKRKRRTARGRDRLDKVFDVRFYVQSLSIVTIRKDIAREKDAVQTDEKEIEKKLTDLSMLQKTQNLREILEAQKKSGIYNEKLCLQGVAESVSAKKILEENLQDKNDGCYKELTKRHAELEKNQGEQLKQFYDSTLQQEIKEGLPEVEDYEKQMSSAGIEESISLALQAYQYVVFYKGADLEFPQKLKAYQEIADRHMAQMMENNNSEFISKVMEKQTVLNRNMEDEFTKIKKKVSDLGVGHNSDDVFYAALFYTKNYNLVRAMKELMGKNKIDGSETELTGKIAESQDEKSKETAAHNFYVNKARELDFEQFRAGNKEEKIKDIRRYNAIADDRTYDIVEKLDQKNKKSSQSYVRLYRKLKEQNKDFNSADFRNLFLLKEYDTDQNGEPVSEKDKELKNQAERFIKAVYGTDKELSKQVYEEYFQSIADIKFTKDMINRDYIVEHYMEMRDMVYKFLMIQNVREAQPEVYNSLDKKLRDRIEFISTYTVSICQCVDSVAKSLGIDLGRLRVQSEEEAKKTLDAEQAMWVYYVQMAEEELQKLGE